MLIYIHISILSDEKIIENNMNLYNFFNNSSFNIEHNSIWGIYLNMKIRKSKYFNSQEVIETPETEIVEENIYIDEKLIKNKSLIRVDMNIVQYPIFSKNTKRKVNQIIKYYFNSNRDTYITVTPVAGDYIPGETEEKVFIALMKIMKQKGMPRKFIITATELKKHLNLNTTRYGNIVKNALLRLSATNYNFKNTMYSYDSKGTLKEEISTPILTLRILSLKLKENKKIKEDVGDNRIKEVYEIEISEIFYKNIITKGYLVYDSDVLLEIATSTARTIYMLIEKLRFNKTFLKIDTLYLIRRIPLKFDKRNVTQTIKILEKSFEELMKKKLIENFRIIKESTWEKSEIEIYFYDFLVDHKQERFYDDFNDFKKLSTALTISEMEHDEIDLEKKEEKTIIKEINLNLVLEILNMMSEKAKKLKTMPKTIKEALENYGEEKVRAAVLYMNKQKKLTSPRAYFLKCLENNWANDILLNIENNKAVLKESKKEVTVIENLQEDKHDQILKLFYNLSEEERENIEEKVYKNYIKKCGQETKIQKMAFKAGKNSLIADYLIENDYFNEEVNLFEEKKVKKMTMLEDKNIIKEVEKFNEYVNESINLYKIMLTLDEEKIIDIKKEILRVLGPVFMKKELTTSKIDKFLVEKFK